jgi:DNA (cytosine-5)-methyltransferase 1
MNDLTCGSLFSGVGGMDIGITSAGFRHEFFAEIDEYCRAVLHHRWPGVTVYDDVRAVAGAGDPAGLPERGSLDLLAGGFPCQDLSVAGKRKGLAGERSGLFHEFMRVTDALRPSAILLENVEGLFSSNGGRDFAVVLEALAERGYEWTYRLLDSQHFGVPQRRRRVFVLAIAGEHSAARRIGEVLALTESSSGHLAEGGPSWPFASAGSGQRAEGSGGDGRVVGTLAAKDGPHSGQAYMTQLVTPEEQRRVVGALSAQGYLKYADQELVRAGQLVTTADIAGTLMAAQGRGWRMDAESAASGHLVIQTFQQKASGAYDEEEIASTQVARQAKSATDLIAFRKSARVSGPDSPETWVDDGISNTLNTFDVGDVRTTHAIIDQPRVRRLTPLECERLQGYPDEWTNIPWRNKDHAPDSRRYSACGNGVTSTVAFWIAARLAVVLNGE